MELNRIYLMDCLEGIKQIEDHTIQAIITDPPYFQGLTQNGQRGDLTDLNISAHFFKKLFKEYQRVLTDTGSLYFFCDWRGYAFYYPLIDDIIGCDNMLVWDKGAGAGNFYTYEHELIIFHSNNRCFSKKGARNIIRDIQGFSFHKTKLEEGKKLHPAQKPIKLIRKLIEDSTEPDDVVLDGFMGSGTTAIAAMQTYRKFIGFEIKERNFKISTQRIENYMLAYTE